MDKQFLHDERTRNAACHIIYVKWAVEHLACIDKIIQKLDSFGNVNLLDTISRIQGGRIKLINENAAYFDADDICERLYKMEDKS